MYSCHLFLICSGSVRSLHFCYCAYPCMKHSLDISSFLEEIPSLSHSIVFLYFLSLFIQESLISPCYSLKLCIQLDYLSLSTLPFTSLLSLAIIKLSQITTSPSCISFSLGWFWSLSLVQGYESQSIAVWALCLPDLITWIYSFNLLYYHKEFDLGHAWMA